MISSAQQLFSDDQAVTASAASTNILDLGAPGTVLNASYPLNRDIGKGNPVQILIQVTTDFATLTSLAVKIKVSDDSTFVAGTRTVLETEAIPLARLVQGYKFLIKHVPQEVDLRYVRLYYTVAGSSATAGKVWAGIVAGYQEGSVAGGLANGLA